MGLGEWIMLCGRGCFEGFAAWLLGSSHVPADGFTFDSCCLDDMLMSMEVLFVVFFDTTNTVGVLWD